MCVLMVYEVRRERSDEEYYYTSSTQPPHFKAQHMSSQRRQAQQRRIHRTHRMFCEGGVLYRGGVQSVRVGL